MDRYICIHGHFYQPPRENPWLEAVELQDSAYPYHDWNERITRECYAPNGASRILDGQGRIIRISNNYSRMSFNFGPSLLSWLAEKSPEVYEAILAADRESRRKFSGHGSALAQAYNHMILPLANARDKYTQILWGLRDFEERFGRSPEGMWLPEAAVDLESLEVMARLGVGFTILAPHQARQLRRFGGRTWKDASGGKIDPSRAYALILPSGRRISLFFYDGPISRAVAFENLLSDGEGFAARLLHAFRDTRPWPQLISIATDGETYGHHHRYGDMALAYALHRLEASPHALLTNYGEFLERHPPNHEVRIFENSSWSCAHGVERWKNDCGCHTGANPGWNQAWRAPLREALDWLRDTLARAYEESARRILKDPWEARDDYLGIAKDRSPEKIRRFFASHALAELSGEQQITCLKLLEIQRHAMLMYTSCGWFFDELSGGETVQILQYAGRAVQIAGELWGDHLESRFLARLERARSNIPEHGDGRVIYEKLVRPAMVDLKKVGAHYALRSLFSPYGEHDQIYCYTVDREDHRACEAGKMRLAIGRARFISRITGESALLSYGMLHFNDHNLSGGVREFRGEEAYQSLVEGVQAAFSRADISGVLRLLDQGFGRDIFSLKSLFRDEQREILKQILDSATAEAEAVYQQLYDRNLPLMLFLLDLGTPLPRSFQTAAEHALNASLRRALEAREFDLHRVTALLEEAKRHQLPLDGVTLGYILKGKLEQKAGQFCANPGEGLLLEELGTMVNLASALPFEVDFWKVQNLYYATLQAVYPEFRERAAGGEEEAQDWVRRFLALGERLSCRVQIPEEVKKG